MEEDIKILEEFIINSVNKMGRVLVGKYESISLENLIKGYIELETKDKLRCAGEYLAVAKQLSKPINSNEYILKSKVRDKIEELKKIEYSNVELSVMGESYEKMTFYQAKKQFDYEIAQCIIKVLQELLEEEE